MSLQAKRIVIAVLGAVFLGSLLLAQWMEIVRKQQEAGLIASHPAPPPESEACVDCHRQETPGVVVQWEGSTHAEKGVSCYDCHKAEEGDIDAYKHRGSRISTLVTPSDCGRCHEPEFLEFTDSHHAKGGNILHSKDNFLAEIVEGSQTPFAVRGEIPGSKITEVHGLSFAATGCQQCHGSKVAFQTTGGGSVNIDDLTPGDTEGNLSDEEKEMLQDYTKEVRLTAAELTEKEAEFLTTALREQASKQLVRNEEGKPLFVRATWPNTGIGRLNLDGSRGSCTACHSRHDFSPRRARQPENCGKCHLGPDHPQKEIFEESKHGIAYRDLKDKMNLDSQHWVLGEDYTQAPTCATCHMSANTRDRKITHDPGLRLTWNNRPPVSLVMDTDEGGNAVKEADPQKRAELIHDTADEKRERMKNVCSHCHTPDYVNAFYEQYNNYIVLYNEKFAKPGVAIMKALEVNNLRTAMSFDEEIEWTWFYLWHHEGRRGRHGASMMAPDYAHWHGSYEFAERFYQELIPQAREMIEHARADGNTEGADAVEAIITEILARPEHEWFESKTGPPE